MDVRQKKKLLQIGLIMFFLAVLIYSNTKVIIPKFRNNLVKKSAAVPAQTAALPVPKIEYKTLWLTDFKNNRVIGIDLESGAEVWEQNMSAPPIPRSSWYFIGGIENISVAPNGNLITSHGDGMMVQEIDRKSHELVWQYGRAGIQTYRGGTLDEPDKSYKFNDSEVVINVGNDREVIVVDQKTNEVVWQYGEYHRMGSAPGLLRGNTSVVPIASGKQFLITDTLEKKIVLIDRATKNIVWEWAKPDAKWLQNVFPTQDGTFILEDRLKGEVFEINRDGTVLWSLDKLSDENRLSSPTDTAKLANGNVLIAESGRGRVVEAEPLTGKVVREYKVAATITSIAVDPRAVEPSPGNINKAVGYGGAPVAGNIQTLEGKVASVNASTGSAGQIYLKVKGTTYQIQVYNYTRLTGQGGNAIGLTGFKKDDKLTVTGTVSDRFVAATRVSNHSR